MATPAPYRISREDDIVRIDFRANPDKEMMMAIVEELSSMENSALRMYVFVDAEVLLSTAEVKEGADYARDLTNQPERIAVVAGGDITYGISRIFKVFRDSPGTELQVFREVDDARDWLRSG